MGDKSPTCILNIAEHGLELFCTIEASLLARRSAQINLLVR